MAHSVRKDLTNSAKLLAFKMANEVQEQLINEYCSLIERFYEEYTPTVYYRYDTLKYSYKPYWKNDEKHGIIYAGIELDPSGMDDVHHDSVYEVFNTNVMMGYHGRPSLGIESQLHIYESMIRFRDAFVFLNIL